MADNTFFLPTFPSFDCETDMSSLGQRWKKYAQRFENFLTATNITDGTRKRALLLHYVGEAVCDIFDILPVADTTYEAAMTALNTHFAPLQNYEYETYLFRQMKQEESETLEQYNTRLRKAAAKCNFHDCEREIKSQIVIGCRASKLRKHALLQPNISLTDLLNYGRTAEISERHNAEIEAHHHDRSEVNWIRPTKAQHRFFSREQPKQTQQTKAYNNCKNCGQPWHKEGRRQCRAQGKTCFACGKSGHFARWCLTNPEKDNRYASSSKQNPMKRDFTVAQVTADKEPDQGYIYANFRDTTITCNKTKDVGTVTLNLNGTPIQMLIDSGATINILNKQDLNKLDPIPEMKPTKRLIYPYGGESPLNIIGQVTISINHKNRWHNIIFYVGGEAGPSLLGKQTSLDLDLIRFVNNIKSFDNNINDYESYLENKYPRLVQGIGKHRTATIRLHINLDIPPVANKYRRLPFHIRPKVEAELDRLQSLDIIERIPESMPTPWISPIVVVPKKNDMQNIRICIDMREANRAIMRERHVTPTLDDVLYELNGAAIFSKLDLNQGYHQLEIEPDSRYITTFTTHVGLFRYKRLNFGINAASEIFQFEIAKLIRDIPGTINISDDILIFGKDKQQHDIALKKTLFVLNETNLTVNKNKCNFNRRNLNFFGHVFSEGGISADPGKIESINKTRIPSSPTEVRSLLGMLNFCARYIPNLASISRPLRELTKKEVKWQWAEEQQTAFTDILTKLTENTKLAYFNKQLKTEIWTDASPVGLAAILIQRDEHTLPHIIAFGSRALTDTESRYSQIEREALGIAWAIEHFELYVYGAEFDVYTDHKPLVTMFNSPRSKLSARLERWRLRLQQYIFKVHYREGAKNPADYLSRHPPDNKNKRSRSERQAEEYVSFLSIHTAPRHISTEEISKHTREDPTLQEAIQNIRTGNWTGRSKTEANQEHLKIFHKLRNELSTNHDATILFKGYKVVIPTVLQDKAINIAHTGHQGIVKTKQLLREKSWFPYIDKKVEEKIRSCLPCNVVTDTKQKLPLNTSELPDKPWDSLHLDHKGPLPNGNYLLVIVDLYTRFPIVEVVRSTSTQENISKLDNVFSLFGFPTSICTDNGPPFNGHEFSRFLNNNGIQHRRTIPVWPQANGEVERFNRTLSKSLKIAFEFRQDWRKHLNELLRSYRATPHTATLLAPADLMFNRPMNIGIPTVSELPRSPTIALEQLRINDKQAKETNKTYFDTHNHIMKHTPEIGDTVLLKQSPKTKMSTPYAPTPYIVKDVRGMAVTSERPGHTITRHATHFKVISPNKYATASPEMEASQVDETRTKIQTEEEEKVTAPESLLTSRYNLRRDTIAPKRLIEEM